MFRFSVCYFKVPPSSLVCSNWSVGPVCTCSVLIGRWLDLWPKLFSYWPNAFKHKSIIFVKFWSWVRSQLGSSVGSERSAPHVSALLVCGSTGYVQVISLDQWGCGRLLKCQSLTSWAWPRQLLPNCMLGDPPMDGRASGYVQYHNTL